MMKCSKIHTIDDLCNLLRYQRVHNYFGMARCHKEFSIIKTTIERSIMNRRVIMFPSIKLDDIFDKYISQALIRSKEDFMAIFPSHKARIAWRKANVSNTMASRLCIFQIAVKAKFEVVKLSMENTEWL